MDHERKIFEDEKNEFLEEKENLKNEFEIKNFKNLEEKINSEKEKKKILENEKKELFFNLEKSKNTVL